MKYMMSDRHEVTEADGSTSINRHTDKEVDEEYVRNYVEAVDFFEGLGGTETVRRTQGRVYVTSVSPGGKVTRRTVFTPIKDGPSL